MIVLGSAVSLAYYLRVSRRCGCAPSRARRRPHRRAAGDGGRLARGGRPPRRPGESAVRTPHVGRGRRRPPARAAIGTARGRVRGRDVRGRHGRVRHLSRSAARRRPRCGAALSSPGLTCRGRTSSRRRLWVVCGRPHRRSDHASTSALLGAGGGRAARAPAPVVGPGEIGAAVVRGVRTGICIVGGRRLPGVGRRGGRARAVHGLRARRGRRRHGDGLGCGSAAATSGRSRRGPTARCWSRARRGRAAGAGVGLGIEASPLGVERRRSRRDRLHGRARRGVGVPGRGARRGASSPGRTCRPRGGSARRATVLTGSAGMSLGGSDARPASRRRRRRRRAPGSAAGATTLYMRMRLDAGLKLPGALGIGGPTSGDVGGRVHARRRQAARDRVPHSAAAARAAARWRTPSRGWTSAIRRTARRPHAAPVLPSTRCAWRHRNGVGTVERASTRRRRRPRAPARLRIGASWASSSATRGAAPAGRRQRLDPGLASACGRTA